MGEQADRLRSWRPAPLPDDKPPKVTPQVQLGTATDTDTTRTQETTVDTTSTIDPVCGMTVTPATAAESRQVDATTYYFCSAHCAATFDADPQRYTTASAKK